MSVSVLQVLGISAVVSGGISASMQAWINRRFLDYQLRRQHQADERKKIRDLNSKYKGRMREAALDYLRLALLLYLLTERMQAPAFRGSRRALRQPSS